MTIRKKEWEVTLFRPKEDGRLEYKVIDVKARHSKAASFQAILNVPGIWYLHSVERKEIG